MVDLSVVIPLYNGLNHLTLLLEGLIPVLEGLNRSWEIFFVDDHSTDGSFDRVKELHRDDSRIKGCRLKENRGQQRALYTGLLSSGGRLVLTMDDDGQHPPQRIGEMISSLEKGADCVYMVRTWGNRSWILKLGTNLTDLFFTLFLQKPWPVKIGSYRVLTRSLIDRISSLNFSQGSGSFVYVSAVIFLCRPRPHIETLYYDPQEGRCNDKSRFSLKSRILLFSRLFYHYGPLRLRGARKSESNSSMVEEML